MPELLSSSVVRIAGYASLAFACVILLLGAGVFWATRSELAYDLDQRILTERIAVLREATGPGPGLAMVVAGRAAHGSKDMRYALLDRRWHHIAGEFVAMAKLPSPGWSNLDFIEDGEPDPARAFASVTAGGGLLIVGADPEAIEILSSHLVWLFAGAFGLIAAIGIGGALLLGRLLSRRLGVVNGTAEAIIAGDLGRRVPVGRRGDEFDRLSATVNRMLDRIEGLLSNLRQVSGDIAHDLRTPLTRLRQNLELGLSGDGDAAALRATMARALDQSDDALALFAAILAISDVEANGDLRKGPVDLSGLVGELADSYRPTIEDGGRAFGQSIAGDVLVTGNRGLLAQMIGNLLDNALRHTAPDVAISVLLTMTDEAAIITVADRGAGIPANQRVRMFERFTRLEHSRSAPGHGLGLSLVAAVARAHGGTVRLDDRAPGVAATVVLPRIMS